MQIVFIGMFFETPEGNIVKTHAATKHDVIAHDCSGQRYYASLVEYSTWKIRKDIKNFS